VQPELIAPLAPILAPIVALSPPGPRVRTVLLQTSRSPEFRRQYLSAFDAALKYRMSPVTVTKWVHEGRLSSVRVRQGRLFVDRRELAGFIKNLPKPGTKTLAKVLRHRRMMALRRLRRRLCS
jgi:hypothetical protein